MRTKRKAKTRKQNKKCLRKKVLKERTGRSYNKTTQHAFTTSLKTGEPTPRIVPERSSRNNHRHKPPADQRKQERKEYDNPEH